MLAQIAILILQKMKTPENKTNTCSHTGKAYRFIMPQFF